MNPEAASQPISPAIARRAVEWLVELQSAEATPALHSEWQHWCAADPEHGRAWQRIEAVNGTLQTLPAPARSALARASLAPRGSPRRREAVKALAVVLLTGGAAWQARGLTPWPEWTADQRTAVGERRSLILADGTQLVLNTATAVDVDFSAGERLLRLVAGEILITTAKDAARRFVVETAQGQALALGTRFLVRRRGDETLVSVYEGAVGISPRGGAGRVLQAGQQAGFSATLAGAAHTADASDSAWNDGFIVARGMRLADFLSELGRYSVQPLACDPAIANLRISGSYPLADIGKVLDALSATLSLRVETVTRFWGRQVAEIRLAPRA